MDQVVTIEADADLALEAIQKLFASEERHPALTKEFLQIVERLGGFPKLFRIDSYARTTAGTGKTAVRFQPSDLLLNFLATVRTIDRYLDVIEHLSSNTPLIQQPRS